MAQEQPVIAVSGGGADSASVRAMMTQLRSAGAMPVFLGNHAQRDARADATKFDAIVVMGSDADIDPRVYEASHLHPKTQSEMATPQGSARSAYEFELIRQALTHKVPLLGVCAGMQRINVACGGTLHQHVPDLVHHGLHEQKDFGIASFIPVIPVSIEENTALAAIASGTQSVYVPGYPKAPPQEVMENSFHHQAVDEIGAGLRPSAQSESYLTADGREGRLIEAIEADPAGPFSKQFVLGVQWHPEFGASDVGPKIAAAVTQAAKAFAIEHPQRDRQPQTALEEQVTSILPDMEKKPAGAAFLQAHRDSLNNLGTFTAAEEQRRISANASRRSVV